MWFAFFLRPFLGRNFGTQRMGTPSERWKGGYHCCWSEVYAGHGDGALGVPSSTSRSERASAICPVISAYCFTAQMNTEYGLKQK